uniref:Uncharacterized protein n=1 Tax=Anguilla anguilla TaxID=7936 RepID=A0A0E9S312_ANGAN
MGKYKQLSQDLHKNCGPPQVRFLHTSNLQTTEGTTGICTNNYMQI